MPNLASTVALMDSVRDWWESQEHYVWIKEAEAIEVLPRFSSFHLVGLTHRVIKLFRRVIEAVKALDADSTIVLSRALFENRTAMLFLTVPNFAVRQGKRFLHPAIPNEPRINLSREDRSRMYSLHTALEDLWLSENPLTTEKLRPDEMKVLDELRSGLPSHLAKAVESSGKFCGMRIAELCEVLGDEMSQRYTGVYSIESRPAHGAYAIGAYEADADLWTVPCMESPEPIMHLVALNAAAQYVQFVAELLSALATTGPERAMAEEFAAAFLMQYRTRPT